MYCVWSNLLQLQRVLKWETLILMCWWYSVVVFALNIIFMYVLLYIDVNNMLVSWCFLLWKTELCVPAIVDVKSQINKMAHNHFCFYCYCSHGNYPHPPSLFPPLAFIKMKLIHVQTKKQCNIQSFHLSANSLFSNDSKSFGWMWTRVSRF